MLKEKKKKFKEREIKIDKIDYTLEEEIYPFPYTNEYSISLFKTYKARDDAKKKKVLIKIVFFEKEIIEQQYNGILLLKKEQYRMPQSFLKILGLEIKGSGIFIVQEDCEYLRLNEVKEKMKEVKIVPIIREIIKVYSLLLEKTINYFLEQPCYINEINPYQIFFDYEKYSIKIDLLNFYNTSFDCKDYLKDSSFYKTTNENVHIRNLGEIIYFLIFGKKKKGDILKNILENSPSISKTLKILLLRIFYDDKLDWKQLSKNPLINQLEPEHEDWTNDLEWDNFNVQSELYFENDENDENDFNQIQNKFERSIKLRVKFIRAIESIKLKENWNENINKLYKKNIGIIIDEIGILNNLANASNNKELEYNTNIDHEKNKNKQENEYSNFFSKFIDIEELKKLDTITNEKGVDWVADDKSLEYISKNKMIDILKIYFEDKSIDIEEFSSLF